jgi:hypothetical protein
MTNMVLQYPHVPAGQYPVPPAYGAAPPAPAPPLPPAPGPPPHRGRRRWIITGAAVTAALAIGVGGGLAIGRTIAPVPEPTVKTVQVPGQPIAQPFTDADVAWCREYNIASTQIADRGTADGLPRSMAGSELPAGAWTDEERETNRQLSTYAARWVNGLATLQSSAQNPTLKLLIDQLRSGYGQLAAKLVDGTYIPADFVIYRNVRAADGGLLAVCERLQP